MSKDTPQPMDASIREDAHPVAKTNHQRTCHAIKQLVEEVLDLFPETTMVYGDYDMRNTALSVEFTTEDAEDQRVLGDLLSLIIVDPRVESSDAEIVKFKSNSRTQDLRDSFNLADAWLELGEDSPSWDGGDANTESDDVQDGGGA